MTHKVLILALLLVPCAAAAEPLDAAARQGVAHYNRQEYQQATNKFLESQTQKPDHPEISYNLGNSDYRLGKYESALESYAKTIAESSDAVLKQKSLYNSGNAWYQLGDLDRAIGFYTQALELDPSDIDSKFNLEFTRKRLTQARESGQIAPRDKTRKGQGTRKGNNPGDDTLSPKAGPASGPGGKSDENSSEHAASESDRSQNKNPSHDRKTPPQETATTENSEVADALHQMAPMTQKEAERWLAAMDEDLKKVMRKQLQGQMKDIFVDPDKDW